MAFHRYVDRIFLRGGLDKFKTSKCPALLDLIEDLGLMDEVIFCNGKTCAGISGRMASCAACRHGRWLLSKELLSEWKAPPSYDDETIMILPVGDSERRCLAHVRSDDAGHPRRGYAQSFDPGLFSFDEKMGRRAWIAHERDVEAAGNF